MHCKAPPLVAVYGGSFNPLHEGHLGIVRGLTADPEVQQVLVVPARRSPFKPERPLLPDAVRWEMLRHALRGEPGVALCDLELRRAPPSYTVDTVGCLASLLPRARLMLVLGWDAFAEFAQWRHAPAILAQAGVLVFDRAGVARDGERHPERWAALLPPPWHERARREGDARLVTPEGRLLVRHLSMPLPDVAARDLLRSHSLEGVPPGAREVLAAYWERAQRAGHG